MTIQYATDLANSRLDQITSKVGASGLLRYYTGAQPASCDSAATGTKLAEFACSATFAPASTSRTLTINVIASTTGLANGTVGYFRFATSGGAEKVQGSVTLTGGGGDLTVDNTSIVAGQACTITSAVITSSP